MLRQFIKVRERYVVGSVMLGLLAPMSAFAQDSTVSRPSGIPAMFKDFATTFKSIFNVVIIVAGIAFVGLFLVGGIMYLTAAGNEDNTKKARQLMLDAVIGLVIVLTSWSIGTYVLQLLGVQGAGNGQIPITPIS